MKSFIYSVAAIAVAAAVTGCGAPMSNAQAGSMTGAVLGGVVGNQFGKGDGKTAATIAGTMAGSYIGGQMGANADTYNQQGTAPNNYNYYRGY